ncbi:MAG: sulfur oxidation c-type cytochrome SoxX [Gammaproteobacteria bacterium]
MFRKTTTPLIALAAALLAGFAAPVGAAPVPYVVENYAIDAPLTDQPGDPARGQAAMIDREGGNCLGCHAVPLDAEFFGTTGPTLERVGARLTPGQIRLRLVDPKKVNPMTMMPAYYKTEGLHRVLPAFAGKTVLTAQQIEDIVAYLSSLR